MGGTRGVRNSVSGGLKVPKLLLGGEFITLEGEYEEEYVLEAHGLNKRVCYYNHGSGPIDGGLTTGWLSFRPTLIRGYSFFMRNPSTTSNLSNSRFLRLWAQFYFGRH